MGRFPSWVLAGCLLLAGALVADACTSGSYMDPKLGYMSFRLYDMPTSYLNNMAYVASGTRMSLLPVTASYNSRGLHTSLQMQFASTGINRYNGTGPAVEQIDLPAYISARYDDVAGVVADLESGKLNPVLNPNFEILTKILYNTTFSTVHYLVRDNTIRSIVIQYGGPTNLHWYENGADTPYPGALANNPLWLEQISYYNNWWAQPENQPYITIHNSQFVSLAGSYNSSHRFLRAARLPQVGYAWEWPADIEISPRYVPEGGPETNPALISCMDIMNSVYLPKGMDDSGGEQYPGGTKRRDISWMAFVADHPSNVLYYHVASSPQWKRICMDDVDWRAVGSGGTIKKMKIRAGKWWIDESNGYARSKWDERHNHQPARMTIDALKRAFAAAGLTVKSVAADPQQAEAVAPDAVAQDTMQVTP